MFIGAAFYLLPILQCTDFYDFTPLFSKGQEKKWVCLYYGSGFKVQGSGARELS
jgi:hypothetical protein